MDSDDQSPDITNDDLRSKLDEVLRLSREQMGATSEMRSIVRNIHDHIVNAGFPILDERMDPPRRDAK